MMRVYSVSFKGNPSPPSLHAQPRPFFGSLKDAKSFIEENLEGLKEADIYEYGVDVNKLKNPHYIASLLNDDGWPILYGQFKLVVEWRRVEFDGG